MMLDDAFLDDFKWFYRFLNHNQANGKLIISNSFQLWLKSHLI